MAQWQFFRHMPVYLSDGRLLGHTVEVGHAIDYIHVQQGNLVVRDWYIPTAAIRTVINQGVVLNASTDDLRRNEWSVPPEAFLLRQGLVVGYEYTAPVDHPASGPPADAPANEGR